MGREKGGTEGVRRGEAGKEGKRGEERQEGRRERGKAGGREEENDCTPLLAEQLSKGCY